MTTKHDFSRLFLTENLKTKPLQELFIINRLYEKIKDNFTLKLFWMNLFELIIKNNCHLLFKKCLEIIIEHTIPSIDDFTSTNKSITDTKNLNHVFWNIRQLFTNTDKKEDTKLYKNNNELREEDMKKKLKDNKFILNSKKKFNELKKNEKQIQIDKDNKLNNLILKFNNQSIIYSFKYYSTFFSPQEIGLVTI